MSTRPRAVLASIACLATVFSSSLALSIPAMASEDAVPAVTAPADTEATPAPVTAAATPQLTARVSGDDAKEDVKVSVGTSPRKSGVKVSLSMRASGKTRVLDTATTNKKGRTTLTIPQKWTSKSRTYTVSARGFDSTTLTTGAPIVGVVPTAVTGLKSAGTYSNKVDLVWSAKSGVSNYIVQYKLDEASDWTQYSTPTAAKDTVTGLVTGQTYDFQVAARNSEGTGPFSTTLTVTTNPNIPGPITGLKATPTDSTVKLDWANTPFATSYKVQVTCETNTLFDPNVCPVDTRTVTPSVITWGGLIDGTTYLFGVNAVNSDGSGPQATITSTPQDKARPVTNLFVTAGDGKAFLSWTNSDNATEYRWYRAGGGQAAAYGPWISEAEADSAPYQETVPELTNGASYTIGVQARNEFGVSAVVSDTPIIPTDLVPAAPSELTAVAGNGQVSLSWMPADRADSYQVSYKAVGSNQLIKTGLAAGFGSDPFSSVITGLDNETEYVFYVAAENDYGNSGASSVRATPTDQPDGADSSNGDEVSAVPSAVTNLVLTPYSTRIVASWSAAANVPTNYDIYYSTNQTNWTLFESNPASDRNSNITGLTNNTAYYVKVTARNAEGTSPETVSGPATPIAVPGQVSNLRATPSNNAVFLNWAPVPGATKYKVTYRLTTTSVWAPPLYVNAPATSFLVPALDNGDSYILNVAAMNGSGAGAASSVGPITPTASAPAPVTNTSFTAGSGSVTLTWAASAGATGYRVTTTDLDSSLLGGSIGANVSATPGTVTYTVPNLINGDRYMFTVVATNSSGYSAPVQIGPAIPGDERPNAPVITSVNAANSEAVVNFIPGSSSGAGTEYGYSLNGAAPVWPGVTASPITITGLTNGTTYSVTVFARNSLGTSPASNSKTFTPNPAPWAAPGNVTVTSGPDSGQLSVTYTAPDATAGATLTGYKIVVSGAASFTQDAASTSAVLDAPSSAVYGLPVNISVFAVGTVDATADPLSGTPSAAVSSAFYAAPAAPVVSSAVSSGSVATVTFTAPSATGGSPVTNYLYSIDSGAFVALSPADTTSPITVPLPSSGPHTVTLKSQNQYFTSVASNTVNVVPNDPPSVPRDVAVTAGDDTLTMTWVAPATAGGNGASISSYSVSLDGGATFTDVGNVLTYTATVNNGSTYFVTVKATNSFDVTGPAAALNDVSGNPAAPWGAPDAVTNVAATLTASKNVSIAFTQGFDGGRNVTEYEYRYSTDAGANWSAPVATSDSSSPIQTSGLGAGTYVFQVRGFNGAFAPWSASSNSVTVPGSEVAAPTDLLLTPYDSLMDVAFNQAGTVDNYAYQTSKNGVEGAQVAFDPAESFSPIFIFFDSNGDLIENGNAYRVRLWAIKDGVYSPASEWSNVATPFGPAPAPENLAAFGADQQCSVTFAQNGDGGAAITNYQYTLDNGATWTAFDPAQATSPVTVSGLTNGTAYQIRIRAYNGVDGIESSLVSCTPAAAPTAPTITAINGLDGELEVVFTSGTGGGGNVANYEYSLDGGAWTAFSPATTSSPAYITGLTNNQAYQVRLRTVNDATPAQVSGPSNTVTGTPEPPIGPAPAPTSLVATPGNQSASISFDQNDDGGAPITNYQYSLDGGAWTAFDPAQATSPVTVSGLTNGTAYAIRLRALNGFDGSASSAVSVTPYGTPAPPTLGTVTAGDSQLTIAVPTAGSGNGRPVLNYEYTDDAGATWTALNPPVNASATSVTITGLTNNVSYSIALRTVTGSGSSELTSAASNTVTGTPELPALTPDAPTDLVATAGDRSASVAFTPGFDGNRPITSYAYQVRSKNSDGSWSAWSTPNTPVSAANGNAADVSSPITIPNLVNGTTYEARLSATNSAELTSPWSAQSNEFTPAGLPCAPTVVSTPGNDELSLAVTAAPECANGSAITGFEYSLNSGPWTPFAASPVVVSSLTNGTAYTVRVRAVNGVGTGPATTVGPNDSTTPFGAPTAPVAGVVTPGNEGLAVAFTLSNGNGRAVSEYQYSLDGGEWTSTTPATTTDSMVIPNLTNGTTYDVRIRAVGQTGLTSDASNTVTGTPYTTPAAPIILEVTGKDGGLDVSFTTGNNGGYALANVVYSTDNGATWAPRSPASPTSPLTITQTSAGGPIVNGTTYQVMLKVISSAPATPISNLSPASNMKEGKAGNPCEVLTAPRNLRVNVTSTRTAGLTWDAPENASVQCPAAYEVSITPSAGVVVNHNSPDDQQASFANMDPSQVYTAKVVAVGKDGVKGGEDTITIITILSPASVTGTKIAPDQVRFEWPAVDGATSYTVTCLSGGCAPFTTSSTSWTTPNEYDKVWQISVAAKAGNNTSSPARVSNQVVTDTAPIPANPSVSWTPAAATSSAVTVSVTTGANTDWIECSAPGYTTQRINVGSNSSTSCSMNIGTANAAVTVSVRAGNKYNKLSPNAASVSTATWPVAPSLSNSYTNQPVPGGDRNVSVSLTGTVGATYKVTGQPGASTQWNATPVTANWSATNSISPSVSWAFSATTVNRANPSWTGAGSVTVTSPFIGATPAPPSGVSPRIDGPVNQETGVRTAMFYVTWNASAGASSYRVSDSATGQFRTTSATWENVPNLPLNTRVTTYVQACGQFGCSTQSQGSAVTNAEFATWTLSQGPSGTVRVDISNIGPGADSAVIYACNRDTDGSNCTPQVKKNITGRGVYDIGTYKKGDMIRVQIVGQTGVGSGARSFSAYQSARAG